MGSHSIADTTSSVNTQCSNAHMEDVANIVVSLRGEYTRKSLQDDVVLL